MTSDVSIIINNATYITVPELGNHHYGNGSVYSLSNINWIKDNISYASTHSSQIEEYPKGTYTIDDEELEMTPAIIIKYRHEGEQVYLNPDSEEAMDILSTLDHYPIICDQTLSKTEQQLIEDAWEYYGDSDLRRELHPADQAMFETISLLTNLDLGTKGTPPDEEKITLYDVLKDIYFESINESQDYPEAEAGSAEMLLKIDDKIAADVAQRLSSYYDTLLQNEGSVIIAATLESESTLEDVLTWAISSSTPNTIQLILDQVNIDPSSKNKFGENIIEEITGNLSETESKNKNLSYIEQYFANKACSKKHSHKKENDSEFSL